MLLYKTVKQKLEADQPLLERMQTFRLMVNDCLRMGLDCKAASYRAVKAACLDRMQAYEIEDGYRFSAMFEAANLVKRHRTKSKTRSTNPPYCRNLFISASIGVNLSGDRLTLPGGRQIALNRHTMDVLSRAGVELASVTATPQSISIVYREHVEDARPEGTVALDVNLENVTTFDSDGRTEVYDLAAVAQLHQSYRRITSRFRRRDSRIRRKLFRKYARMERNRKDWLLNNVSSTVVYRASALKQAIVMENLKGIREMFRSESGSSAHYLAKLNYWPFAELQRQVEYKAKWAGLPVIRVEPEGTSSTCSACGGAMAESPEEHPLLKCRSCGLVIDRDLNAAKNILSRGLRSRHVAPPSEAMVGRASRERETASKVDGGDPSDRKVRAGGPEYC